jgi:hypothetical protein
MQAALIRLARILAGQVVAFLITNLAGISIPVVNISIGALISAIAKYLRDTYNWTWLPV